MPFQSKGAYASLMLSLCFAGLPCAIAQQTTQPAPAAVQPAAPIAPSDQPALSDIAPTSGTEAPTSAAADTGPCCVLPDGSLVRIEIAEALSSKTAQRGQIFKLRLLQPLAAPEGGLLPVGTEGVGEVVHAERSRGGGKAGELILAARHLEGPDGPIKLRGMKLGGSGSNKTGAAIVASLVLPLGGFVRGSEIEIPLGTNAVAKLAGAVHLPLLATPLSTPPIPPNTENAATAPGPVAGEDSPTPTAPTTPI